MRWFIFLLPLFLATTGGQCGPSDEEAGRAVLISAPLALAVGVGLMRLLLWLWRKTRPEFGFALWPSLVAFAVLFALLLLSLLVPVSNSDNGIAGVLDWVAAAILMFGTSFLTLHLVFFRIWLWAEPASAFTWAFLPALLLLLPALPMAFHLTESGIGDWIYDVWLTPGWLGLVTGPLLLLLLAEAGIRWWLVKRRAGR